MAHNACHAPRILQIGREPIILHRADMLCRSWGHNVLCFLRLNGGCIQCITWTNLFCVYAKLDSRVYSGLACVGCSLYAELSLAQDRTLADNFLNIYWDISIGLVWQRQSEQCHSPARLTSRAERPLLANTFIWRGPILTTGYDNVNPCNWPSRD